MKAWITIAAAGLACSALSAACIVAEHDSFTSTGTIRRVTVTRQADGAKLYDGCYCRDFRGLMDTPVRVQALPGDVLVEHVESFNVGKRSDTWKPGIDDHLMDSYWCSTEDTAAVYPNLDPDFRCLRAQAGNSVATVQGVQIVPTALDDAGRPLGAIFYEMTLTVQHTGVLVVDGDPQCLDGSYMAPRAELEIVP
jgi:hypothetical protein